MNLTLVAIDRHSSDTMSRTFSTEKLESFKESVQEFEDQLPFKRYELTSEVDYVDVSDELAVVLDELEITY